MRKMKKIIITKCIALSVILMPYASAEKLEMQWEIDGFKNPESVVYDKDSNLLYVSNVNGQPSEKTGNGYISTVSVDGKIVNSEWVSGLNAPKGLAVSGSKLYVADIDTLVVIDIDTGSIIQRHTVVDAEFLNDVAAGDDGSIYVTDMMLNRIHRLQNNHFSTLVESEQLENPNGILVQKDHLVIASWGVMTDGFATEIPGHLKTVSLKDMAINSIGSGNPIGNLDGLEADGNGNFYVTDWMAGKFLHVNKDGDAEVLLNLGQGSADHTFIPDKNLILIPMMNDNKLLAYRVHIE